ncbi:alcohol dehydrogenase catalytic domain-containing protein [Promicromonospora sp. MS192]|uniref:alcohol dehydrogenase catalytic domain-containing protein n=1 Tax=Promicromonospora sp. MS192 TaxID=3412684 RepID=UPI003C301532
MRAVVVHGAGDLRVEERPDPVAGPGEVLVAMEWGGVCGSDVAYWRNGSSGTAVLRDPLVLGHEVAGRVAALGPGVSGWTPGTPVTVHPATATAESVLPDRLAGRTNLHSHVRYFGSAAFHPHTDGGFSELRAVPAAQLRRLPDGVSTEQGALAEPLAVAMHAVRRAGVVRGRDVVVNGAGPIGCLVVAAAKHAGAATVTAADVSGTSLAVAKELGADRTLNVAAGDTLPQDSELVFEASGAPAALGGVLRATARGGTLVQVGNLPGAAAPAALGDLVTREITWVGAYRFVEEISDALDALRDGLDVSGVVTHRFGIEDAGAALAAAAGPESSKVLIRLAQG